MPFKNTLEVALLDHLLTDPTYTPATTLYLGLSSTVSDDAGANFTEPSGGGYARVATTAADWAAAVAGNPSTKTSTAAKASGWTAEAWLVPYRPGGTRIELPVRRRCGSAAPRWLGSTWAPRRCGPPHDPPPTGGLTVP